MGSLYGKTSNYTEDNLVDNSMQDNIKRGINPLINGLISKEY